MQEDNKYLIPLNIDGSIKQIQTKATAQGFVDKDAVGLFAVNYSENNTIAGVLQTSGNQADNVKYVFDEPNHKWNPVRPVYYKNINTHADLYLYYPYQGTITDVNSANFEVQKDQSAAATATSLSGYEASDWMWGKGEDITPSESKVQIQLTHRLSAVQVSLTEGSGFESGEFESLEKIVILSGTTRKATLDYATGGSTPVGSAQLDGIIMCPQSDGSWRAVVIPQAVAAGTKLFSLTIGGTAYSYSQDTAVEYQTGKQMNVSLTINKKSLSGDYEILLGSTQIVDWTEDLNTHGGEARQYYVVNLATAGTLQSTIEAAGKNPAKIRNLKIVGVANADDFYFMRDHMDILEAVNMKETSVENNTIPNNSFKNKSSLVYFVFPENITIIGDYAFNNTLLSGVLIIPDSVVKIGNNSFAGTNIGSIQFPQELTEIGSFAFRDCQSTYGSLILPDGLKVIKESAFNNNKFNGTLHLPENLEVIGPSSFYSSGSFTGDLSIPEKVTELPLNAFRNTTFSGSLDLANVQVIGSNVFNKSGLKGELVIPEGVIQIGPGAFRENRFSSIVFSSTIKIIDDGAFYGCSSAISPLIFPEGLVTIGGDAFGRCSSIPSIELPSTLQILRGGCFHDCFNLSSIISRALDPPTVQSGAFSGVAKEDCLVEVPSQSLNLYRSEGGWSDFRRITAHYDFYLNRSVVQALNEGCTRILTLHAPSGFDWSIQSKPDWLTINPSVGSGKADVTITISPMARTNETFEVNEGSLNNPKYVNYQGRNGEVIFLLNEKEYTSILQVEQYDSDYVDGAIQTLQTHTQGSGIDIVFTGDGYSARDIARGTFSSNAIDGYGYFFDVEPYKSYQQYFDVYVVTAISPDSGIGTLNTIVDTKFSSTFTQNRPLVGNTADVFDWARRADNGIDFTKSLVVLLMNTSTYEGVTIMKTDGSAIACCPVSQEDYPYDFRGIVQHEAGGHGFGKLADEYIYHNSFLQNCDCSCCEHPQSDNDIMTSFGKCKALGWYKNLTMSSDSRSLPWAHLIYHPQYSDYVDVFEGGYMHSRGIYRSEATSCMNNNIPYYSAISRQAIVERIKYCAGEQFSLEGFYANDKDDFGPITKSGNVDRTFGVDPNFVRATGQGPILISEHSNIK